MAVELNFNRENESISWGFRLTGGADLNLPITVIKVAEKSIAEDAGMQIGDMLVGVGDNPTAGLTHLQVHDIIKEAGNTFVAAVIRGELPPQITESEETFDSETTQDGISQSVQINIKANVVDTTQILVESGEVVEQNIRINGAVVSDQEEQNITISKEETESEEIQQTQEIKTEIFESSESQTTQVKDEISERIENFTQPPECIKQSEVLKVIKEDQQTTEDEKSKIEKRWTTFLQKPNRPKPKIKPKTSDIEEPKKPVDTNENYYEEHVLLTRLLSLVQEPPYRVIIQKQKKKRDEEKARSNEASQESTPIPAEMLAETPVPESVSEAQEETQQEEEIIAEEGQTTELCDQTDELGISEVELSLEEQLAAIQKQLLALSQLPAAIQQTLEVVTQQLTKIVGPPHDPNEENETEEYHEESTLDESDIEEELRTGELETLEEVSESGFDRESQEGEEQEDIDREDFDKPEPELEMLQVTPEPEEDPNLTPEEREAKRAEREKMDKKQKENPIMSSLRQRPLLTGPLTPLQRPICLPGGRRWHAPDDAHPELPAGLAMSDEQIAETISAQTELIVGTTLGDANTHLVRSKALDSNKINFLKYQPPPKSLDHLKHSEVYRLVHDMDQPANGVGARGGKAMAEEDYYAQARQEGQTKG